MILITGGMGFIGLHTTRRFLDAGEEVMLTRFNAVREPEFLQEEWGRRVFAERVDITSTHDVMDAVRTHKVTGIVHLAVPRRGMYPAREDYRTNMTGLINILEAARIFEVRRVTVASSTAVYGSLPEGPYREETPLPMASSDSTEAYKKAFEILGLHYGGQTGLEVVPMRIGGIYGPLYQRLSLLPARLAHAAMQGVEPDFGSPTGHGSAPYTDDQGDWCYVKDTARAIQMIQMAERLPHSTYNVGPGRGVTNGEVAAAVNRAVPDARITLQPGNSPNARPSSYMDTSRIRDDLGWAPEYDIERGMTEYIGWLREHAQ